MDRILITGFEPFLSHAANPTAALVERLDGGMVAGARIVGVKLPVAFDQAAEAFAARFRDVRPDAVLMFGLAYSYDEVRLERLALNLDDAAAPDNAGVVRRNRPIVPGGPMGYWSTLPVDRILDDLDAAGFAAKPSRDAGGYVCNHLFFRVRHLLETEGPNVPAGFIHVPPTPSLLTAADRERRSGWEAERIEAAARLILDGVVAAARAEGAAAV